MVFGINFGRGPGPEEVGAIAKEEEQPRLQADFICVQGNIRPEHRVVGGGLIEAKMDFSTFRPDPSKTRRNSFLGLAIMTEEEYSALSTSGGGINPDLNNSMGFIDDKDEEGKVVEITPRAKMVLEEEKRRTRETVSEARMHEQPQVSLDGDDELGEQIERAN